MDAEYARLEIECPDGLAHNTSIKVDGKMLDGVNRVRLEIDANTGMAIAYLEVHGVEAHVTFTEAEWTVVKHPKPSARFVVVDGTGDHIASFATFAEAERFALYRGVRGDTRIVEAVGA